MHAASNAHPSAFSADPVGTMRANLLGVMRLLEGLRAGGRRLLFVSTGEIYGENPAVTGGFREDDFGRIDPMNPRSCYPESKRAAETLCASYASQYGLDCVVARLCYVYGPDGLRRQHPRRRAVPAPGAARRGHRPQERRRAAALVLLRRRRRARPARGADFRRARRGVQRRGARRSAHHSRVRRDAGAAGGRVRDLRAAARGGKSAAIRPSPARCRMPESSRRSAGRRACRWRRACRARCGSSARQAHAPKRNIARGGRRKYGV